MNNDRSGAPGTWSDPYGFAQSGSNPPAPPQLDPYGHGGLPPRGSGTGAPMDPKKKKKLRLLAILGGFLVLLIVAGSFTHSHLANNVYGPATAVEEYLDALKDGDAEKAFAMNPPRHTMDTSVITNEVYRAAENRVSGYKVRDTTGSKGPFEYVTVDVTRGSETTQERYRVEAVGEQGVFFSKWKLSDENRDYYWSVEFTARGAAAPPRGITVNGVQVTLPEWEEEAGSHSVMIPVLPGDFSFEPILGGELLQYGKPSTARMGMDRDFEFYDFSPTVTAAGDAAVEKEVKASLDACMASTSLRNLHCPNDAFKDHPERYRNISWSPASEPAMEKLEGKPLNGETIFFGPIAVETVLHCEIDPQGDGNWKPHSESIAMKIYPEAAITADKVELRRLK